MDRWYHAYHYSLQITKSNTYIPVCSYRCIGICSGRWEKRKLWILNIPSGYPDDKMVCYQQITLDLLANKMFYHWIRKFAPIWSQIRVVSNNYLHNKNFKWFFKQHLLIEKKNLYIKQYLGPKTMAYTKSSKLRLSCLVQDPQCCWKRSYSIWIRIHTAWRLGRMTIS